MHLWRAGRWTEATADAIVFSDRTWYNPLATIAGDPLPTTRQGGRVG